MTPIAILVSANMMPQSGSCAQDFLRSDYFELEEQMAKLTPAFARHGFEIHLVLWNDIAERAREFDGIMPLFIWDYFEGDNAAKFLAQIETASHHARVLNSPATLNYNSNKAYLDDLGARGAPVIESIVLDSVTEAAAREAAQSLGAQTLVIKPQIGAGAWRQALWNIEDPFPSADDLPPGRAILQAFLPSVQTEGEYSFLYFGGEFSHAVNKRPKDGDYRIQSSFGGRELPYAPKLEELATAKTVLSYLSETPIYARVDLLRGLDGDLKLIELEMIEPYLYLPFASDNENGNEGAQKLASAVAKAMSI